VAESEEDRRRQEAPRLYFEAFQQIATLNTAAGLVIVAVFRESTVPNPVAFASLGGLAISLLSSLCGMYLVITRGYAEDRNVSDILSIFRWILGASVLLFGLGLIIALGFFVAFS
jgi:hypothetical protein